MKPATTPTTTFKSDTGCKRANDTPNLETTMAKMVKASDKPLVLDAVRPYRKELFHKARNGVYTFRVYGSGKEWFIAIDTGSKVVRLTSGKVFAKMGTAIGYVFARYGQKATQFKVAAKLAA